MPPTLTREQFKDCLNRARSFGVWIQISPVRQMLWPISEQTAKEIADEGFENGPIWGQLCQNGCLELSITSQWYDAYILERHHGQT